MTIQTLTIGKRRFVVVPEREFRRLQKRAEQTAVRPEFAQEALKELKDYRKTGKAANWADVSASWGSDMAYTVKLAGKAQRQIEELPQHVRNRVARWLDLVAEDPYRRPSCKLEGYPELRRIHASKDYVIVYSVVEDEVVVLVVRVAHRRDVYRGL